MLALRLTRGAHPAVQLRRLLVTAASAGTGFLLLCALGHALGHPGTPSASALRLAWCAAPTAATVYLAVAVARTDPGTRPRPGLSAVGLGPARLMAISATTTALSCTLGSLLALLVFLYLRGGLARVPLDGAATDFLAADRPLPFPAALTLLALVPLSASAAVAVALRPREPVTGTPRIARAYGRFGAGRRPAGRETFGAYGRFGRHLGAARGRRAGGGPREQEREEGPEQRQDGVSDAPGTVTGTPETVNGTLEAVTGAPGAVAEAPPAPARPALSGLPWGITVLAVGLAAEAFASRTGTDDAPVDRPGALVGLALTTVGLALAGPGLTHLCGLLLQAVRPGALRLLAGRILMSEATRIGRPLGVVCAVLSAVHALASLNGPGGPSAGPLTALGVLVVTGCTVATLLTAAVEAKHARADATAALLRVGAPAVTLRKAAALRAGALLAVFGPLTLLMAELSAWPLAR
ncbi:hypothetical protein [Streptomyces sp. Tu 3180]|uniref:hypothetical protein n=1 Tax=Streptomyces sp. Tu 3180 TaxID=2682611 RepID=UPI00135BC8F1|nr:hypothetical protein [Streptomyces sp. Tu 3180]KAF3467753.1 hypothetical protein GL259_27935 [Streptomyces sp. Tu 3180]